MCGIVGFIGPVNHTTLLRMRDALTHRGPDGAGDYVDQSNHVSLGHRRLSIVDLEHGQQPMVAVDGQYVLVFNGEIYNHPELKTRLQRHGHRYRTNCDTESILHAYCQWGEECVHELDGMFALVIYDRRRMQLFGARDRFGKKPFYYMLDEGTAPQVGVRFAFASELKGLRAHPALCAQMTLSMDGVVSYLLNDYVVGERSIYDCVRRLPPGGAFTYQLSQPVQPAFRQWRYWEPEFGANATAAALSLDDAADEMLRRFESSVRMRLMSDVPLGAFISGGIDSAAIVAMMTRLMPHREVKTFCIGFEEESFDEAPHAQVVADHFGTDHHVRRFTVGDMLAQLPAVLEMMDEPYADPSILPVTLLSQFAREHVTVALGGDGGDEIFAGYDPFRAVGPAQICRRVFPPVVRRRVLEPLVGLIPATDRNMPANLIVSRFLRGLAAPASVQAPVWMGAFSLDQLRCLLPDHCAALRYERAYPEALEAYERIAASELGAMTATIDFFQRFYLPDDILLKVDRASMAHSLEVRCPMLDRGMAEFANGLPTSLLFRRGQTKRLLRRMARKPGGLGIPNSIVQRKKKGFGIPVGRWIRGELREQFERSLLDDWPEALGMFDRNYIRRLHARHVNRAAEHYKELWALFILAQWVRRHEHPSPSPSYEACETSTS